MTAESPTAMTPAQLAEALAQLGYVLERAEGTTDIRTWPEDEAEAYREFRFQEGRDAAHAVRVKKLAAALIT